MSMGNSKFNVSDASTLFPPVFLSAQNMAWFELSGVELYRHDLRGNENYLRVTYYELAGGSSYRGFELPRVKLQ